MSHTGSLFPAFLLILFVLQGSLAKHRKSGDLTELHGLLIQESRNPKSKGGGLPFAQVGTGEKGCGLSPWQVGGVLSPHVSWDVLLCHMCLSSNEDTFLMDQEPS